MLTDVLDWIDTNLPASLDRLFDLLRIESISTDPAYAAACRKAADWLVADLLGLGFEASARPTPGHPIVVGHHAGDRPASPVLRPLRRAAGRSPRSVGSAALRTEDRRARWRRGDRGARRRRRQGPVDDLRRGSARLEGGHRQAAGTRHHAARRRGGIGQHQSRALPLRQCRGAEGRPRAGLRYRHVAPRPPGHHRGPARSGRRGGRRHLRQPRPSFRHVWRRGAQPAARSHRHPGGAARCRRPRHAARLLRRRRRAARRHQAPVGRPRFRCRRIPRRGRALRFPPARRAARCSSRSGRARPAR